MYNLCGAYLVNKVDTLQRQQEYAEARLRILGDAGSTEENKPKPIQQKSLEQVCSGILLISWLWE